MLTNANVNRNDRQAKTEEYSHKVRTVVGVLAGFALHMMIIHSFAVHRECNATNSIHGKKLRRQGTEKEFSFP